MTLQVIKDDLQGWTVLHVLGEVDYAVVPELREHVRRAVADGDHRIVLELTRVEFLDSTGIGTLVAARRLLRSTGGSLRLVMPGNNDHHVNRVFTALGLRRLFDVHPDLTEALSDDTPTDEDLSAVS
ncbi:STAS domain-containing protein [Embleya sp. NPDC020630]|uniref:STAS domain-containing protein n=1 Tax=unclassified Embleya TaxID=2699296 RepID=UPI0037A29E3A